MRLGEAMIKEGLITNDTLVRALERQVIFGARLGTNLVEMGAISEENLAKFLGKIFGVPYAGPEQFEDVPQEVLDAFPAEMARKYTAFPIKKERSRLHLAMTDPNDISVLDELRFILGLDVRGCIASEIRIHYALEKYYDIKRDLRYIAMPDEEQAQDASSAPPESPRAEEAGEEAGDEAQAPGMAPEGLDAGLPPAATESIKPAMPMQQPATVTSSLTGQAAQPASVAPAEAAQVLTAPVIHAVKPAPPAPAAPAEAALAPPVQEVPAPPEPVHIDARPGNPYASLASPSDREDIAEAILAAAKASLARAALFMVKGSVITCWKVSGPGPASGEISVTLDAPSIFKDVVEDGIFYKGPVLEVPQNMLLLDLFGGAAPLEAIAYPLIIKEKVVGVLYGDDGAGSMIKADVRSLGNLMAKASMSLEILILKNKILADA